MVDLLVLAHQVWPPLIVHIGAIKGMLRSIQGQAGCQAGHILTGLLILGKSEALLGHSCQLFVYPALRASLAQHF